MRETINRKRLKNKDLSLISSNCNGAVMVHSLGMRFNSPFVNLFIKPKDYIKLLTDLKGYLNIPIKFTREDGIDYPIGVLDDIRIYFQHYSSEEEAIEKWNRRKERINYQNMFVLFSDRDGCSYNDLVSFDSLPYKNKIVFTHVAYPELRSAFYIEGFEKDDSVGICSELMPHGFGKLYLDQFDYVSWFNKGEM